MIFTSSGDIKQVIVSDLLKTGRHADVIAYLFASILMPAKFKQHQTAGVFFNSAILQVTFWGFTWTVWGFLTFSVDFPSSSIC